MDKKIKIAWTSFHCCIRVIKQVVALIKTGKYEIHGLAQQVSYGTEKFDRFSFYHNRDQFRNHIKNLNPDIFIHSNEPNWQVNVIREIKPDAKIILDAHDLDSIRQGFIPLDEHKAITNSNGIIFVSRETSDFIHDLHKHQLEDKPTAVIEHYCNEEFLNEPDMPPDRRQGLVYQGGLESPPYKNEAFKYRQLYPIIQQLVKQGLDIHLMPGNEDACRTYANIGAFLYKPQMYPDLMKNMRNKKWGLVIFNNAKLDQNQVNLTRTNKEQEYLACGMPLIVFGAPATAKWVEKHKVGLCFDKTEDITPDILDNNYDHLKKNVDNLKSSLAMEQHIYIVEELIDKLYNYFEFVS